MVLSQNNVFPFWDKIRSFGCSARELSEGPSLDILFKLEFSDTKTFKFEMTGLPTLIFCGYKYSRLVSSSP